MAKIQFKFGPEGPGWERWLHDTGVLMKHATRATDRAGARLVRRFREDDVIGATRGGAAGLAPIHPHTWKTRAHGKPAGIWPARSPVAGTAPMWATGETLRALRITRRLSGRSVTYDVAIRPGATSSTGRLGARSLQATLARHETGFPRMVIIPVSVQMLRYLHSLLGVRGASSRHRQTSAPVSTRISVDKYVIVRLMAPRPVLGKAYERLLQRQPEEWNTYFFQELRRAGWRG